MSTSNLTGITPTPSDANLNNTNEVAFGFTLAKWLIQNWKVIVSIIMLIPEAMNFIQSFFGNKSEAFKGLSDTAKQEVKGLKELLSQAVENNDPKKAAHYLKSIAAVYEDQAKTMTPEQAKKARDNAKVLRTMADGITKGTIPLNNDVNRVSSTEAKPVEVANKSLETKVGILPDAATPVVIKSAQELGEALATQYQNLITSTLKTLGLDKLDDKSAQRIALVLLTANVDANLVEQALATYYEKVQGLSAEDSAKKAEGIVDAAQQERGSKQAESLAVKQAEPTM